MDEKYVIVIEIKAANIAEIEGGSTNLLHVIKQYWRNISLSYLSL